jgi:ketosteroid isomerase-like protein
MTTNAERASTLVRALQAAVQRDAEVIEKIFTDDVRAWTPALVGESRTDLLKELQRRDDAFSDVELSVAPLETGGDYACAEWTVSMTHSGKLEVNGGVVEPTGVRVTINGMTVAEFAGAQICSIRQYWDELAVFEQLGLLSGG